MTNTEAAILGGLATIAAPLLLAVTYVGARILVRVSADLTAGGITRLTPSSKRSQRIAVAAVVYGCPRVWTFAACNVSVSVAVGPLDNDETREAISRLERVAAPRLAFMAEGDDRD